ncbi:butyrate kinase [Alicyclobacillaceae bacterium I2511]|nr:butyrate kinase [Alicyclobacillaceae bacterium I2511]
MGNPLLLAIDPGSTSTKFALYLGEQAIHVEQLHHPEPQIFQYPSVAAQADYRLQAIVQNLLSHGFFLDRLDAVVGRGGFLHSVHSGVYRVNEAMVRDLQLARYGEHASNLGAILAYTLADKFHIPAYIVDPIVVDEMADVARLSGIPELQRKSYVHALNVRAVSYLVAQRLNKPLTESSFVVAHLGSGISVVAMKDGRMVDVNNANSEGPFAPERAGGLPAYELVKLCYSGHFSEQELLEKITKKGGLYAYLGAKDIREIEQRMAAGDSLAETVLSGMVYQIAKEIGAMATALEGRMDGIILTGGMAYSEWVVQHLLQKISFLAPVSVIPGERELDALAQGILRVLHGKEQEQSYTAVESAIPLSI